MSTPLKAKGTRHPEPSCVTQKRQGSPITGLCEARRWTPMVKLNLRSCGKLFVVYRDRWAGLVEGTPGALREKGQVVGHMATASIWDTWDKIWDLGQETAPHCIKDEEQETRGAIPSLWLVRTEPRLRPGLWTDPALPPEPPAELSKRGGPVWTPALPAVPTQTSSSLPALSRPGPSLCCLHPGLCWSCLFSGYS